MSPEQAMGKGVDHRSDIFSTGIILYELVTGERPFRGDSVASVLSAILRDTPPSVTDVNPDLPRDLQRIIRRCMVKDVERRYQTSKDLRNELEELKQEVDSGTEPAARIVPARRRGPGVAAAAGLVLLAVAATFFYLRPWSPGPGASWSIRPLTSLTGSETGASWSPDGSFIAYSHTGPGSMDIFVMSLGGGDPVRLTDNPADDVLPRWSSDGRYLAFLSDRGSGGNVHLIPALGGAERKVAETNLPYLERFDDLWGALGAQPWSPDGQELLFSRSQPTG
jgi:serine/threonine protein kinase